MYKIQTLHLSHSHCQTIDIGLLVLLKYSVIFPTLTCRQASDTGWLRLMQTRVTGGPRFICTMWNCIDRTAEWPYLLTSSNCSHSESVLIIWYQAWKSLYNFFSCYILYSTTTQWLILYKVVGDSFASIEALNRTPGHSNSGGVHWSDHHQPWGSCTSKKGYS